jgi:hypothetical protein
MPLGVLYSARDTCSCFAQQSSASPPVLVFFLATDVPSIPGILEDDVAQAEEEIQAEASRDVRTWARNCINELDALLLREVFQSFVKYFVDGCVVNPTLNSLETGLLTVDSKLPF